MLFSFIISIFLFGGLEMKEMTKDGKTEDMQQTSLNGEGRKSGVLRVL